MSRLRWPRVGFRREVVLLLTAVLLALILLSSFTLFSYRGALEELAGERRGEALKLARGAAAALQIGPLPSPTALARLAPSADRLAILDGGGEALVSAGAWEGRSPRGGDGARSLEAAAAFGPSDEFPDAAVGFAPFQHQGRRLVLRVDLDAGALAAQRRGLRILFWVVLPVNLAMLALMLVFLRHLLGPFEQLLTSAQRLQPEEPGEDEVSYLVSTVERALASLTRPEEEEIATLQRALGRSLASGLLLLDSRGRVLTLNPLGAELLGVESGSQEGRGLEELLEPHPALLQALRPAVAEGHGLRRHEVELETAPGAFRTLGLTVHPLVREEGDARAYLVLFADLTESRRRAEEEKLAMSLAQVGELAAGVAHELRNSLATIQGYLTLIDRRPRGESAEEYLAEIRRESDHLQRVLEDFLSFARPDSTRLEETDLLELVERVTRDPQLGGRPVRIQRASGTGTRIRGDSQLLERAVRNLLLNAAEAEREAGVSGSLEARLVQLGDQVELSILDRGPGLPREVRERLFEPFATGRPGGVGLGLALAHRIVTLHGGRLRLEDRAGGGTRAVVALPLAGGDGDGNRAKS